jgi:hypothetical protein
MTTKTTIIVAAVVGIGLIGLVVCAGGGFFGYRYLARQSAKQSIVGKWQEQDGKLAIIDFNADGTLYVNALGTTMMPAATWKFVDDETIETELTPEMKKTVAKFRGEQIPVRRFTFKVSGTELTTTDSEDGKVRRYRRVKDL